MFNTAGTFNLFDFIVTVTEFRVRSSEDPELTEPRWRAQIETLRHITIATRTASNLITLEKFVMDFILLDNPATTVQEFCKRRDAGYRTAVTREIYDYFLEVLPPAFMHKQIKLMDGTARVVDFGFAEGWENVTVFWCERKPFQPARYFAEPTNIMNPNR